MILSLCLGIFSVESNAQWITADTSPPESVSDIIEAYQHPDAPGATYVILQGGKVIESGFFGLANVEHNVAITNTTRFNVASLSKQFTAYAILQLVDAGMLDLDKPVNRYLPELTNLSEQITVRHLIHHTSGLKDDLGMLSLAGWRHEDLILSEDVLNIFRGQTELSSTPGTRYSYSNTNYSLLALILSKVTGQTFAEWTRINIFEALHMEHSGFVDSPESIVPDRATNYEWNGNQYKRRLYSWHHVGPGGLFTTAEDLAKWVTFLLKQQSDTRMVLDRMAERGQLSDGSTIDYAYGLVHSVIHGFPALNHGGSGPGNQSNITIFPKNDLAVLVLSNQTGGSFIAGRVATEIAELYLRDATRDQPVSTPARQALMITTEDLASTPEGSYPASPETYPKLAGTYQLVDADRFKDDLLLARPLIVSADGNRLLLSFGEPPGIPLAPIGENRFRVIKMNFEITFQHQTNGEPFGLIFHITDESFGNEPAEDLYAVKQNPEHLTPGSLHEYTGLYYSPELETVYRISMNDDETLFAFHPRHGSIPLRYLAPDEFLADTHIFTNVRFKRGASGLPEEVRLRGYSWNSSITLRRIHLD